MDKKSRRRKTYSAREFFQQKKGGTMMEASHATGVGYTTIQAHVKRGVPIKHVDVAKKLQEWDARISAAKTLGLE